MTKWPIDPWLAAAGQLSAAEYRKFDDFLSDNKAAEKEFTEIVDMHFQLSSVQDAQLTKPVPQKILNLLGLSPSAALA